MYGLLLPELTLRHFGPFTAPKADPFWVSSSNIQICTLVPNPDLGLANGVGASNSIKRDLSVGNIS